MANRTITLRSDLVERLEALAIRQGRSLDEVFSELLASQMPEAGKNWALAVAEAMETADINWLDDPDASRNSREHFKRHLQEKWQRTQNSDGDND